jgi:site-specific recombinase XerC
MPSQSVCTMTLKVLRDTVRDRDDLPPQERAELCSAIKRLGKIAAVTLSDTPADGPTLRALFASASWQLADLSKGSWANIKFRVTKAARLVGVNIHTRRQFRSSADWAKLISNCEVDARHGLTRFGGWCTTQGIAPNQVNAETFDKYLDYLVKYSTVTNPRERWHVARRAWNRYIADVDANFPHISNNEPDGWRGLPLSEFPVSLRVGFENWRTHMLNSDPFANAKSENSFKLVHPRKTLKEITANNYIASLRQSASRLIEAGDAPVTQFASLQAFVDLDTVKTGLRRLLGNRNFDDARPAMHALMTATLNLAAYLHVKEDDLDELKSLAKRVRHRPIGMCERNRTRLQPFKDKEVLRRLIRLPLAVDGRVQKEVEERLKKKERKGKLPTMQHAQAMQMAVLFELLLHVPMRVKNAASLALSKHFQLPAGGKPGKWRVSVAKGEVKNDKAIDAELSVETSALFERYVSVFRPALCSGQSTALFVSQGGQQKGPSALARQFRKFIGRELGLTVNIHLMRHLMAFAFLEANPGDYEGARQLLGHKQITTTINFYSGAESAAAFRRLDKLVDHMRDEVLDEETGEPVAFEHEDVL